MSSSLRDIFQSTPSSAGGYSTAAGMLFVMRCVPDIFTGERLNIGVCGVDSQGRRKVKVVTEPGRLQCIYGEGASNVLMLAQAALEAAKAGVPSPSPQVVFDVPTPYYNSTLDDVVESSFADQVTVALPHREVNQADKFSDEAVQKEVADLIKSKYKFDFGDLLANTPQVIVNTDRGARTMTIPLQPRYGVGTVRSGYFAPTTLKTHLMDSVLDLDCAARYRQKRTLGLFILRPRRATDKAKHALDAVIDSVAFRSPPNLILEQADRVEELAEMVADWGRKAA